MTIYFLYLCLFALLCFALLCFALLCFALLCFALLCFALLCFALLVCLAIFQSVRLLVCLPVCTETAREHGKCSPNRSSIAKMFVNQHSDTVTV